MNQEYQDKIDKYLLGQMSERECLDFEKEIEDNVNLKEQFEFTKNVKTAIAGRNRRLAQIKEWEDAYKGKIARTYKYRPIRSRVVLYWASGIAALFVVGFFLFDTLWRDTPKRLMKTTSYEEALYCPSPQGTAIIKGIDTISENLLAKGDYKSALNRIETLEEELSIEIRIFEREKGSREVEQDELKYRQEMLTIRREGLMLLKAQALTELNRLEEAISLLDVIRRSGTKYQTEADSLYHVIKR